jgi:hypothetical protein
MKYRKPELSSEQLEVMQELIKLAGIGCLKEIALLNEHQSAVIQELGKLGYVTLYKRKRKFMVVLPP